MLPDGWPIKLGDLFLQGRDALRETPSAPGSGRASEESTMEKLFDWKARRAGGRITINAKTAEGLDRKVVGVDLIEVTTPWTVELGKAVIATDRDGVKYHLIVTP